MAEEAGHIQPIKHLEIIKRKIDIIVNILKNIYVNFGKRRNIFLFILQKSF